LIYFLLGAQVTGSRSNNNLKEIAEAYSRQLANMNATVRMLIGERNNFRKLYYDALTELEEYKKNQERRFDDTFSSIADQNKKENGRLAEALNVMRQQLRKKTEELRSARNAKLEMEKQRDEEVMKREAIEVEAERWRNDAMHYQKELENLKTNYHNLELENSRMLGSLRANRRELEELHARIDEMNELFDMFEKASKQSLNSGGTEKAKNEQLAEQVSLLGILYRWFYFALEGYKTRSGIS
jgi:HAMP domain-containing protein